MIQAAVASGDVPATALMGPADLRQFASRGIIEPLDEYIKADKDFCPENLCIAGLWYDTGHVLPQRFIRKGRH